MNYRTKTIRTFIGAKNYNESREFYRALEFEEVVIDATMCLFKVNENLGFYLQDFYVIDCVNNTMIIYVKRENIFGDFKIILILPTLLFGCQILP